MCLPPEGATSFRFSTDDLPLSERGKALHELFERKMLLAQYEPLSDGPPRADLTRRTMPGLGIVSGAVARIQVHVTRTSHVQNDDLFFCINCGGKSVVRHGDAEVVSEGGAIARGAAADGRPCFAVRRKIRSSASSFRARRWRRSCPISTMPCCGGCRAIRRRWSCSSATFRLRGLYITDVHDLAALALGATRDAAHLAAGRGLRAARLRAIKSDIAAHLADPELAG